MTDFLVHNWPLAALLVYLGVMAIIVYMMPRVYEEDRLAHIALSVGGPPLIFMVAMCIAAWPAIVVVRVLEVVQKRL